MDFDTFEKYNTDEAYKDKDTTAKGLVAAYKKDNPEGNADDFYAKLNKTWAQDKDGHVKNAVNEAFKVETPKVEKKPVETAVKETVEEVKPEKPTYEENTNLKRRDKEFLKDTNAIAANQEQEELDKILANKDDNYDYTADTIIQSGKLFRNIDDHAVSNLPTFMFKRYADGEFGDPKGKDAKIRLAYFMLNGLQSKLKNASNAAMAVAGRAPMFADTTSDYDKYQQTNFANAMENRWNKYKQETQAAIDLAKQRNMTEEEAYDSVKKITRNQKLNTAFNMMNEKQKVYLMNITKEIGDKIGTFDNDELIDFLTGAAVSGDQLTWQEAAAIAVARFGPTALKKAKDKKDELEIDDGEDVIAGIGGSGKKKTGVKLSDGTVVNPGKRMTKAEYDNLVKAADNLREKYSNGEIDEETFQNDYAKLKQVMDQHTLAKIFVGDIKSTDKAQKEVTNNKIGDLQVSLDELNAQAKAGNISIDDYKEQFDNLMTQFKKWGATEKELSKLNNSRVSDKKISDAIKKQSKKK